MASNEKRFDSNGDAIPTAESMLSKTGESLRVLIARSAEVQRADRLTSLAAEIAARASVDKEPVYIIPGKIQHRDLATRIDEPENSGFIKEHEILPMRLDDEIRSKIREADYIIDKSECNSNPFEYQSPILDPFSRHPNASLLSDPFFRGSPSMLAPSQMPTTLIAQELTAGIVRMQADLDGARSAYAATQAELKALEVTLIPQPAQEQLPTLYDEVVRDQGGFDPLAS